MTHNIGTPTTTTPEQLNYFHKNPRTGNVTAIQQSIQENGVYKPIIVNKGTHTGRPNEVLAGNHTLKAIRTLAAENPNDEQYQNIDIWLVDVDDTTATKIVLADNKTADLGTYDQQLLADLLQTVDDNLDGTGYTYEDLDTINQLIQTLDEEPDWADAFSNMPQDEPSSFTRSFNLTKEQADIVDSAIDYARTQQDNVEGNANGAALHWICGQVTD